MYVNIASYHDCHYKSTKNKNDDISPSKNQTFVSLATAITNEMTSLQGGANTVTAHTKLIYG